MEGQQDRDRSPSLSHLQNHTIGHQPSPPQFAEQNALGLDPSSPFNTTTFNPGVPSTGAEQFNFSNSYLNSPPQAQSFQQQQMVGNDFPNQDIDQSFKENNMSNGQRPTSLHLQSSNHQFVPDFVDPFAGQDLGMKQDNYNNAFMLDPSLQPSGQQQNQSINPADVMGALSPMSPPQGHMPAPANLMQVDQRSSPQQSPSLQQGQFFSPGHSRHASLDPASAGFPHGQPPADWSGMMGGQSFQQHRRAPSEHSDVSSVAPSPFLQQHEGFDPFEQSHSPLLGAQQDGLYQESLGIERFTISDGQHQRPGLSPRHSPYPSPRMSPHPGLGIAQENSFVLPSNDMGSLGGGPGVHMYNQGEQSYSDFRLKSEPSDMGQAAQMAPPEINVELAPPSKQSIEPSQNENNHDALSPPDGRGRRGRIRAKSDPSFAPMSRPMTPAEASPNLSAIDPNSRHRSLSPFDATFPQNFSRDASPGGSKTSRRSSTSSIPNRDYILELADPSRPSASGDNRTRVQKHPATFQCTLCPKRFTRAYNLRSHLRTHTDERPFVCTVCGKAFARQHDRKRHEGLHSGEKKFVCRGELATGGSWGCGRRFARADALGRHFRSEAGRVCIKPLLDEEAQERQRLFEEQMMTHQGMGGMQQPPPQVMDMNNGSFTLPAALLAQYPALQGLQWDQLGNGPDDGEISGRGSFDAGAGDYFEEEEGSGYVSGPGTAYGNAWGASGHEWASDYEGR